MKIGLRLPQTGIKWSHFGREKKRCSFIEDRYKKYFGDSTYGTWQEEDTLAFEPWWLALSKIWNVKAAIIFDAKTP